MAPGTGNWVEMRRITSHSIYAVVGMLHTPGALAQLENEIYMMDVQQIFSLRPYDNKGFQKLAMDVFHFQYAHNIVYREFCDNLERSPGRVRHPDEIPFLPIDLFKNRRVVSFEGEADKVFRSSGTTGSMTSRHHVADLAVYERSFLDGFRLFYGAPDNYCILALLPGYLERQDSSLVYMANRLIEESRHPQSGFYLDELERLADVLKGLEAEGQRVLLLGVSFALLDFAERHPMSLSNSIVMETGGMKGRRREMVREELHGILCRAFDIRSIHSEYGMTELLSQAWSKGEGRFECPPWMRVLTRDSNDPLSFTGAGQGGGINVIDLANMYSCSFIATQDLGRVFPDRSFEVLGRFDQSDVRGCNLMAG